MALIIRRNGATPKSESDRLGDIRERIRQEAQTGQEDSAVYLAQLKQRINKYERRCEMTSDDMIDALQSGKIRETRDIVLWAWTWQTLNRIHGATPTTGTH